MPYKYEPGDYNPLEAYFSLRAEAGTRRGRRLALSDQCQIFCLSKAGFTYELIGRMFAVTAATVSNIANCLRGGTFARYNDVRQEWKKLGEEDFIRAYLPEDVFSKAQRMAEGRPGRLDDPTTYAGVVTPNPGADRFAYKNVGDIDIGKQGFARIGWEPCPEGVDLERRGPAGWRIARYWQGELQPYAGYWNENAQETPWRTSGDALDALYQEFGLKSPRRPGRPQK